MAQARPGNKKGKGRWTQESIEKNNIGGIVVEIWNREELERRTVRPGDELPIFLSLENTGRHSRQIENIALKQSGMPLFMVIPHLSGGFGIPWLNYVLRPGDKVLIEVQARSNAITIAKALFIVQFNGFSIVRVLNVRFGNPGIAKVTEPTAPFKHRRKRVTQTNEQAEIRYGTPLKRKGGNRKYKGPEENEIPGDFIIAVCIFNVLVEQQLLICLINSR